MKKNIGKILAMAIVAIMMMSTIAFADAAMGEPAVADKAVTVTLTGLTANEEATILVVKDDVTLSTVTDADIVYIDQLTVGEDGSVTFALDASAAIPAEPTADVYVDIFCGYTNMADADPLEGTAKIYTHETQTVTDVLGDVNMDKVVDDNDAVYLLSYITFKDIMPDLYPVTYGGTLDFEYDDVIDDADAVYLLSYVTFKDIMPDLYPIYYTNPAK